MLPQEIKELPSDEALIFYEGLRPIRCQKIRYFADREVQKAAPAAAAAAADPRVSAAHAAAQPRPGREALFEAGGIRRGRVDPEVEREATSADIAQLRSIQADDVVIDPNLDLFAGLEGAPLQTEAGMNVAINRYMGGVVYARAEVL